MTTTFPIDRLVVDGGQCLDRSELGPTAVATVRMGLDQSGRHQLVLDIVYTEPATSDDHQWRPTAVVTTASEDDTSLPSYGEDLTADRARHIASRRDHDTPRDPILDGAVADVTLEHAPARRRLRAGILGATLTVTIAATVAALLRPEPDTAATDSLSAAPPPADAPPVPTTMADGPTTANPTLRAGRAGIADPVAPTGVDIVPADNSQSTGIGGAGTFIPSTQSTALTTIPAIEPDGQSTATEPAYARGPAEPTTCTWSRETDLISSAPVFVGTIRTSGTQVQVLHRLTCSDGTSYWYWLPHASITG